MGKKERIYPEDKLNTGGMPGRMAEWYEEELKFYDETDIYDIGEAEASFFSIHGHVPGAMIWPKQEAPHD